MDSVVSGGFVSGGLVSLVGGVVLGVLVVGSVGLETGADGSSGVSELCDGRLTGTDDEAGEDGALSSVPAVVVVLGVSVSDTVVSGIAVAPSVPDLSAFRSASVEVDTSALRSGVVLPQALIEMTSNTARQSAAIRFIVPLLNQPTQI